MTEPIFDRLRDDAGHAAARFADGVTAIFGHHRYHDRNSPGCVPEDTVSLITEVKTGLHDIIAKLEQVDEAAAGKLEAAQANPGIMRLVDAGLAAVHVPPEAFELAVSAVEGLEKLYNPDVTTSAQVAVPGDPAPAPAA